MGPPLSWGLLVVMALALAGCGTSGAIRESEGYASEGQYAESVEVLREQLRRNPDDLGACATPTTGAWNRWCANMCAKRIRRWSAATTMPP